MITKGNVPSTWCSSSALPLPSTLLILTISLNPYHSAQLCVNTENLVWGQEELGGDIQSGSRIWGGPAKPGRAESTK